MKFKVGDMVRIRKIQWLPTQLHGFVFKIIRISQDDMFCAEETIVKPISRFFVDELELVEIRNNKLNRELYKDNYTIKDDQWLILK